MCLSYLTRTDRRLSTYESAKELMTVTSQTNSFPPVHGITVIPFGRLPSGLLLLLSK